GGARCRGGGRPTRGRCARTLSCGLPPPCPLAPPPWSRSSSSRTPRGARPPPLGQPLRGKAEKIATRVRPGKASITVVPCPLADVHYRYPPSSLLQPHAAIGSLTLRPRLGSASWAHKGGNVTVR